MKINYNVRGNHRDCDYAINYSFLTLTLQQKNFLFPFQVNNCANVYTQISDELNVNGFQSSASNESDDVLRISFSNSKFSLIETKKVGTSPLPLTLISPRNVHLIPKLVNTFAVSSVT